MEEKFYSYQEAPNMIDGPYFHGENWKKCPHCGASFEYYDLHFERYGIVKVAKGIYKCPKCNKLMRC